MRSYEHCDVKALKKAKVSRDVQAQEVLETTSVRYFHKMYIYIILARDITDIFTSYFLKRPQVFLFHLRVLSLVRSL